MYTIKDVKNKKIVEVKNFLNQTQLTDLWYKAMNVTIHMEG